MRRVVCLVVVLLVGAACSGEPGTPRLTRAAPLPTTDSTVQVSTALAPSTTLAEPVSSIPADRQDERSEMVDQQIASRAISDLNVLGAMASVPRHEFVPAELADAAYGDHPLPIGYGQTISQPYIVALMSQALDVVPGDKVLEIGTGSGYQAAVLAAMGLEVYTIEIIPELADRAATTLGELGYGVSVRTADGYFGWEEQAPFDGIIVTAAPDHVPQPLVDQLGGGGVMVIPVGPIGAVQTLWRFSVGDDGEILAESLAPVSFVPFTRAEE